MDINKTSSLLSKHLKEAKNQKRLANKARNQLYKKMDGSIGKGIRKDYPITKTENGKEKKIHKYDYDDFKKHFDIVGKGSGADTSGEKSLASNANHLKSLCSEYQSGFFELLMLVNTNGPTKSKVPKSITVEGNAFSLPDYLIARDSVGAKSPAPTSTSSEAETDNKAEFQTSSTGSSKETLNHVIFSNHSQLSNSSSSSSSENTNFTMPDDNK